MPTLPSFRTGALVALLAFTGAAGAQYATSAKSAAGCYWLFQGERKPAAIENFDVARETARSGLVDMPSAPSGASAVSCYRTSPVPEPHDYEVLLRGYPLFLWVDDDNGENTVLALGVEDGQFKVGVTQGSITDEQRQQIVSRLEGFYEAYDALQADE